MDQKQMFISDNQLAPKFVRETTSMQLRALVQNMGEGLILADATGKIILCNPSFCKMYGFNDVAEALDAINNKTHKFVLTNLDGEPIAFSEYPLQRVLRGETFSSYEVVVRRTDISGKWTASYNGAPIYDESHNILFVLLTIRDVTFRIKSEQELRKAINSRDEFLSIASHELKTPLTSLKLQVQSTMRKIAKGKMEELTPAKLTALFEKNEEQIDRLTRLVDDMLDLTRVQSGRFAYNFLRNDLAETINCVIDRFKEQFENQSTRLINNVMGSVYGYFDKERIEQVVNNLLTNALKYGQGKTVIVDLVVEGDVARIEIQDHGMGIGEENFEIIFKKFERVVSADEISGLGIGLFISKEMVEAHGGRIWVESDLGVGSKFIVELPIIPE